MITVHEARKFIAGNITVLGTQTVSLAASAGRVLSEDVIARLNQPVFDNSAMDGFAVRASDLAGAGEATPIALPMKGIIAAGTGRTDDLASGHCQQIMTGAPVPEGADAVVLVEATSGFDSDPVKFYLAPVVGQAIRLKGEETAVGEMLFARGHRLRPFELGVIASHGMAELEVHRQPRVSIINTGNELRNPDVALEPGQIYNSNQYTLPGLVEQAGGAVVSLLTVDDNRRNLKEALSAALDNSDVVITTGGVSMGRYDQVGPLLKELNVAEVFWNVAQKPGKPLYFGKREAKLVFGLPGNPVSVLVTYMEYVWPALFQLQGTTEPALLEATLAAPFPRHKSRERFLSGRLWLEDGRLMVHHSAKLGSHMLSSITDANVILAAGPGIGDLEAGTSVRARLLPGAEIIVGGFTV